MEFRRGPFLCAQAAMKLQQTAKLKREYPP